MRRQPPRVVECQGKRAYASPKEADKDIKNIRRRHHLEEPLHPYKCSHCRKFHIGHKHD